LAPVGRALQLFGLILLPAALLYGLTTKDEGATGRELVAVGIGALAFLLGTAILKKKA
jgi:hypothetical protein